MSETKPSEKERDEALATIKRLESTAGALAQKFSWTRQSTKEEVENGRMEREDALIGIMLAYRSEAERQERERCAGCARKTMKDMCFHPGKIEIVCAAILTHDSASEKEADRG